MNKVKKVFLIDDDDTFLFLARASINKLELGISIETFLDGERALDHLKLNSEIENNIPELIFVDINMPYMDGWRFFKEFSKLKSSIKKDVQVYLASSSDSPIDVEKANSMENEIGYLVKPISKADFLRIFELYPQRLKIEL